MRKLFVRLQNAFSYYVEMKWLEAAETAKTPANKFFFLFSLKKIQFILASSIELVH